MLVPGRPTVDPIRRSTSLNILRHVKLHTQERAYAGAAEHLSLPYALVLCFSL